MTGARWRLDHASLFDGAIGQSLERGGIDISAENQNHPHARFEASFQRIEVGSRCRKFILIDRRLRIVGRDDDVRGGIEFEAMQRQRFASLVEERERWFSLGGKPASRDAGDHEQQHRENEAKAYRAVVR